MIVKSAASLCFVYFPKCLNILVALAKEGVERSHKPDVVKSGLFRPFWLLVYRLPATTVGQ